MGNPGLDGSFGSVWPVRAGWRQARLGDKYILGLGKPEKLVVTALCFGALVSVAIPMLNSHFLKFFSLIKLRQFLKTKFRGIEKLVHVSFPKLRTFC